MSKDTKANDCVSAPPVAPFVQKGRQQVGSLRKMPAAQRHHERRKSLALPIAGKVGHFTTQTLAEDGHIQCEVIPVCHDRGRERQPPVAQTVKARRRQAAKTPLRSAGQAENRDRALGRVKASQVARRTQLNGFQFVYPLDADSQSGQLGLSLDLLL